MQRILKYIISENTTPVTILDFLKKEGFSRHILSSMKNTPNTIILNSERGFGRSVLKPQDHLIVTVPETESGENIIRTKMDLDILYEDDYLLVINKPEGMLSVPGKGDVDSVYQRLSILYPEATGPIIVHRLDMATSGLLLAAKTKEAHQNLQAQFKNRTIQKRYIALLEGEVPQDEGEIRLPLCPDPLDRPRQIVSEEFGKPALTHYRVLERTSGKTLIAFYPQTGRTHQLRVHAAHPQGLHCPILGDELYGRKAERLYLHAEYLAFTHPITSERIEIRAKIPFSQH